MSIDHCIITKYNLSEREQELKKAFFRKKGKDKKEVKMNPQNEKLYSNNLYNDEVINKLVEENFPLKSKNVKLEKDPNMGMSQNNTSLPLNLIYSQNKILERNVDILQETQRSIHDLLIFNLKAYKSKDSSKPTSTSDNENQLKLMQMLVAPLYNSLEGLKSSINKLSSTTNYKDEGNNLNDKVKDMISKHNDFKENSTKIQRSVESIEKNKQIFSNKDNTILKALEELKGSVSLINNEMNKMENEFNNNLKRIIEENEKKNLKNLMEGVNSPMNKLNSIYMKKRNNNDQISYAEHRNELLDINQRKEDILNEIQSKKVSFPKPTKPTEKINFSYKLDFEEEKNSCSYKNMRNNPSLNNSSLTDKEIYSIDKNVFLNNLNSENYMQKTNKNNDHQHSRSLSNKTIHLNTKNNQNQTNLKKKSIQNLSIDGNIITTPNNNLNINSNNSSTGVYPNYYQSPMNIKDQFQEHQVQEQQNIVDKMNQIKDKMSNYKHNNLPNSEDEIKNTNNNYNSNSSKEASSINYNMIDSTKHSEIKSTEPSSSKYLKSPKMNEKKNNFNNQNKLDTVQEDNYTNTNNDPNKNNSSDTDIVLKQIKLAQKEIEKIDNTKIRKGISQIEVSPQEQKSQNLLEDVVLKLCIDKLLNKKENIDLERKKQKDEFEYVKEPQGVKSNNFPLQFNEAQVKSVTEGLFRDLIKNLIKNKKNKPVQDTSSSIIKEYFPNLNDKIINNNISNDDQMRLLAQFKEENDRRDKEFANYLSGLMDRFSDMEKTINNHSKNNNIKPQVPIDNNLNVDDMVNLITEKIKGNMQIHINLTTSTNNNDMTNQQMQNKQQLIVPTSVITNLQIEAVKKEIEEEADQGEDNNKSGYSHPFADTRRVNYEEVNRDILLPHLINLQDYDISSSSCLSENTITKRSQVVNKDNNINILRPANPIRKDENANDESASVGQVLHTEGDSSSDYDYTHNSNPSDSPEKKIDFNRNKFFANTGLNLDMLKMFNEKLKEQLLNIDNSSNRSLTENNEINHSKNFTHTNRSEGSYDNNYQPEESEEQSTISININKHMINLNNNQDLKTMNLYDSDEHKLFQRQFGGESDRVIDTQLSRRMNSNTQINNNPVLFSFQKVVSNRSNQENDNFNTNSFIPHSYSLSNKQSNSSLGKDTNFANNTGSNFNEDNNYNNLPKLSKVSNEDLENLVQRQNSINDRLKLLSNKAILNSALNNNTIPENYSEADATINADDAKKNKREYRTDESSLNYSSSN